MANRLLNWRALLGSVNRACCCLLDLLLLLGLNLLNLLLFIDWYLMSDLGECYLRLSLFLESLLLVLLSLDLFKSGLLLLLSLSLLLLLLLLDLKSQVLFFSLLFCLPCSDLALQSLFGLALEGLEPYFIANTEHLIAFISGRLSLLMSHESGHLCLLFSLLLLSDCCCLLLRGLDDALLGILDVLLLLALLPAQISRQSN